MKNYILYVSALASALFTLPSCSDFLNQMPKSALTEDQVFGDIENIIPAVDGLYTSFRGSKHGREGWSLQLLGLDEAKQGEVQMGDAEQSGLDYYNGALNGTHSKVTAFWNRRWPTVSSAANAIYALDRAAEQIDDAATQARIKLLKGDACFIRAMLMFELTMLWGEVPVIDMATTVNSARQPLSVVWDQIISDFTYAAENLPERQTADPRRATSGAALAMLGKVYMYAPAETGLRDYSKARDYFSQIMSRYSLDPSYAHLFSVDIEFDSPESIFELDYFCDWNGYSCWQWDMGSRTVANTLGEPCYYSGYDVVLPTEFAYKMKSEGGLWEEGDLRREVSIRFNFDYEPTGQVFTTPAWGADELDPHIKKWEDMRTDAILGTSQAPTKSMYLAGKNYLMLRFADILLLYAECLNELGQTGDAVNIVNQVRERAWGGALPAAYRWSSMSAEEFRTQIMDERIRELCFEGWRRMDLIRTGKFVELIRQRNKWAAQSGTIQPFHMRYPIPDSEIRNNADISAEDQNPGYN